jgi:hypothetical protein
VVPPSLTLEALTGRAWELTVKRWLLP